MNESLTGKDALKQLPATDVLYPKDTALSFLTERTRKAFTENIDTALRELVPDAPQNQQLIPILRAMKDQANLTVPPGGLALSNQDVDRVYEEARQHSFETITRTYMERAIPRIFADKEAAKRQNPGNVSLGILLDLLSMIDPETASFEDGVQTIIDIMRENPNQFVNPFILGTMFDDATHLRGTALFPFELLMSREEAERFQNTYFGLANTKELKLCQQGIDISYNDLHLGLTGHSAN